MPPKKIVLEVLLNIVLVAVGFVLLIKGADFLVGGASSLAKRFKVADITIGLTVVAMGTSAPELVVNLISGSKGDVGLVYGNIIGSNIFNLFLILGISAVIYPITVQQDSLWKEVPFSLLITILLFVLLNDGLFFGKPNNELTFWDGSILLCLFGLFLIYIFFSMTKGGGEQVEEVEMLSSAKTGVFIFGGMVGLALGGNMIVENAVIIAKHFEVSEKLIGLTILAAGTSLPELATTAVAAFKKKSDLAVGNIVGSNIFNILLVLGATAMVGSPLPYDDALNLDLFLVMIGTFMLFVFMFTLDKFKIDRIEGVLYLVGFMAYSYYLFYRL